MGMVIAILAALYLLGASGRSATISTQPRQQPATGTVSPTGGTRVAIPGVGEYINLPGGTTSITLDPTLFGSVVDSFRAPQVAQPVGAPDYQAFDTVTSPVDYAYGDYGFLAV